MCAISIPAPPLKTSVAACYRRAPHLAADTCTSHQNRHPPEQKKRVGFFLFLGKKRKIKSHLVLYLSGKSQKKEHREYVLMPPDPHRQISSTLSHGPKKNIKNTFACQNCQTPLLHSDIYKVEKGGSGAGGKGTCIFR